ncbi:branched-chain amino acid ABC transporter permease [Paracoccus suum]|uniref:Branched-chain amino acid ABC transporter permease n=1 Tax=Paracoccus suum TaxID=2259340 RepID=A0A344PHA7_9RHOB|nr:AzlC family ABC transporter permease [Paracoccus suum]AXC48762.1 branched-chain amino acid ABC transporter permease [Paracoccus suum]
MPPDSVPGAAVPASAPTSRNRAAFLAGMLQALPFLIVLLPFGLVFGVTAVNAGMDLWQVLGFSTIVLAGASQITAVQLLVEQAPLPIVILSALAVNLRMAMYSASLVPWVGQASPRMRALLAYVLIDQTYALSIRRYEENPRMTLPERLAFFFGVVVVLALPWPVFSVIGATLGQAIPPEFALDFAVPITFLAMIAPLLRSRPHLAAAVTGFAVAAALRHMPSGTGLMIAAPIAMAVGAELERRQARRQAQQPAPEGAS